MINLIRFALHAIRQLLLGILQLFAALILLFEEWGWEPLARAMAWLARLRPVAWLESVIVGLPPYVALVAFVLPTTLLFPLKLLAMWLLASGKFVTASALFMGAKVVSTALVARIFSLTKPALMQISWFARAYHWFVPWKDAAFAAIRASWGWRYSRMLKTSIKLRVRQMWSRVQPGVAKQVERLRAAVRALRQLWPV